jgi:hypothetical protein
LSPDGSLILFDMHKLSLPERFIKRIFNLATPNTKSQSKLHQVEEETTTTIVKIGFEYQAITNEFSLSQIKN